MAGIETDPTYGVITSTPYVVTGYAAATVVIAVIVIIVVVYLFFLFGRRR